MSYIGATGLTEYEERFDTIEEEIDSNANYINTLVGIPDPIHLGLYGINIYNPSLYGLVERAEVNISALQATEDGLGTDLSALTTQVEGIETSVGALETSVGALETSVSGLQTQILGIDGDISTLNGAVFLEGGAIALVEIQAADALTKANRALDIWDYSGNNTYNMKSGNVGIGILPKGTLLNNKLEVNGNINIPTGSTFRIGDEPFNYTHLAGTQPVSSKWTNATDVDTNIYYNSGNVGIGVTTAINNKLEVNGNINIPTGSKYKINNVDLAFSDLGTLSYNSLSDKPTLFDGNYNSLTNKLTGGTNIQILNGAINNLYSYTLPTAGIGSGGTLGGVRVDNSTIFINGSGVISSAAGTPQVNSDWTQTNTSLKSFIQNKPTAGTNISFAGNTITNIITGSPTQDIITLNNNYLTIKDKPDTQIVTQVDVPLTSANEPIYSPIRYVVQAFTHSELTELQTTHTFNFPVDTLCDILIVGGGGSGSESHGGGGGAGAVIFMKNVTMNGSYTIKVGKGGICEDSQGATGKGGKGNDSEIFKTNNITNKIVAEGGGGGGQLANANGGSGGSGGGGDAYTVGPGTGGATTPYTPVLDGVTGIKYGNNGGNAFGNPGHGGGGGGAGGAGENALAGNSVNTEQERAHGGVGIKSATINSVNYDFKTLFGTNAGGVVETDGFLYFGGGGGNGRWGSPIYGYEGGNGGLGGGGKGGWSTSATMNQPLVGAGYPGINGTGGGGGGGGDNAPVGGNGGSGIVIIRYVAFPISEGNPITHKTLNFAYLTTSPNTYTLSVQPGTSIQVNNQPAQYLSGNYTISVGATQSSVLISGFSPANQTDPYPLQNGSTIAIRYSMLQRITSTINIKKDGLIKYVPASGTNPTTGSWNIIDIDTQPLTQFAGNLPISRIDGNLPANRLDNIDMSKVATGNLDWSRIASQPALSSLAGNLPLNRTDGNLPASRLDNIDMGKVATGNLHHSRVQDLYLGINDRFFRIINADSNTLTFSGIWVNNFKIQTNLHLNSYDTPSRFFQYFLSMSPNNVNDRHMYWFGVVKMSNLVGTDPSPLTRSSTILSSDSSLWGINDTNSTQGVWWLNVTVYTTTRADSLIAILH